MSINTRVRTTSPSIMGHAEVQHQRHRARRVRKVTRELDVPTSLTPAPNHLLRFYFVGCAKEVSNLINHPVVRLFGSRVISTGCHMVTESVDWELFATTGRERKLLQCRYCVTNTRDEESLSETRRPGLITEMRSGLLTSGRISSSRVLVQQYRHWRSFLSRPVVAKSSPSAIMLQPVPLTREPKRLTTGRLIKLLTSFAQPTK